MKGFLGRALSYQAWLYHTGGAANYPKALYIWSWSLLWPVLVVAVTSVLFALKRWRSWSDDQAAFLPLLMAIPILMLPDWDRSVIIAVPSAILVATGTKLSKDIFFATILALGALSTALARPLYAVINPPRLFLISMILISVAASVMVIAYLWVRRQSLLRPSFVSRGLDNLNDSVPCVVGSQ